MNKSCVLTIEPCAICLLAVCFVHVSSLTGVSKICVCICVCKRERDKVTGKERERQRPRESVCLCVRARVCFNVCVVFGRTIVSKNVFLRVREGERTHTRVEARESVCVYKRERKRVCVRFCVVFGLDGVSKICVCACLCVCACERERVRE